MASTKAKTTKGAKPKARRKAAGHKAPKRLIQPYDAKQYAGTVPAFASVVAEEMKAWREDR